MTLNLRHLKKIVMCASFKMVYSVDMKAMLAVLYRDRTFLTLIFTLFR